MTITIHTEVMATDLKTPRSLIFVSSYPPSKCGIATYTSALIRSLKAERGWAHGPEVLRLAPRGDVSISLDPEVIAEAEPDRGLLNLRVPWERYQLAWIQHEYGILGSGDGEVVLDFVERIPIPVVSTLHTVLADPSPRQRYILEELVRLSTAVVVLSHSAEDRLRSSYPAVTRPVEVIPHGANLIPRRRQRVGHRPQIVTWGLIGPGKGYEVAIQAMDYLRHLYPPPLLVIAGATHPNVKRRQGESYRSGLQALIKQRGLGALVEIRDGYMTSSQLTELVQSSDLALLPYQSTEQVTSGVLTEALAAGLPVVATAFPHAVELLSDGAGTFVMDCQPYSIAQALESYLSDPPALARASNAAQSIAQRFRWHRVAQDHERVSEAVMVDSAPVGA